MIHSINNTHEICDKFLYNTINFYLPIFMDMKYVLEILKSGSLKRRS